MSRSKDRGAKVGNRDSSRFKTRIHSVATSSTFLQGSNFKKIFNLNYADDTALLTRKMYRDIDI